MQGGEFSLVLHPTGGTETVMRKWSFFTACYISSFINKLWSHSNILHLEERTAGTTRNGNGKRKYVDL